MEQRNQAIDVVRGIGMILVIVGHFIRNPIILKMIYSFHVPLFFVISGFLQKLSDGFVYHAKKRFKALMFPYITWGGVIILVQIVLLDKIDLVQIVKIFLKYILQIRYTTMWFLPCLFCSELIFVAILNLAKRISPDSKIQKIAELFEIIVLTCFGFVLASKFNGLIWNIDIAFIVLPFMYVGYLMKQKNVLNKLSLNGHKYDFLYMSAFLMLILFQCKCKEHMDLFYGDLGDYPVWTYISASILSVLLIFIISRFYNAKASIFRFLNYVGRNTIVYFTLHQMVIKQVLIRVFDLDNDFKLLISAIISIIICTFLNRTIEMVKNRRISL